MRSKDIHSDMKLYTLYLMTVMYCFPFRGECWVWTLWIFWTQTIVLVRCVYLHSDRNIYYIFIKQHYLTKNK